MKGDAAVIEQLNIILKNELTGHQPIFSAFSNVKRLGFYWIRK